MKDIMRQLYIGLENKARYVSSEVWNLILKILAPKTLEPASLSFTTWAGSSVCLAHSNGWCHRARCLWRFPWTWSSRYTVRSLSDVFGCERMNDHVAVCCYFYTVNHQLRASQTWCHRSVISSLCDVSICDMSVCDITSIAQPRLCPS